MQFTILVEDLHGWEIGGRPNAVRINGFRWGANMAGKALELGGPIRFADYLSLDGSGLDVADEAANREAFGVPGTQQGRTGYPQLRLVALLENATHVLFGVALGGYRDSEVALANQAWGLLLAHHVVRKLMFEAALVRECPRFPTKSQNRVQ